MKTDILTTSTEFSEPDPKIKLIADKIKAENYKADALIEILHTAQNAYGYLPMQALKYIAKTLHLPPSRVFSTVTFYHLFSLKPKGKHTCLVCTGTACYLKGSQLILNNIEKQFALKPGQLKADNKLDVRVARCIGVCGLAPLIILDNKIHAKINAEETVNEINAKIAEK